MTISASTLSAWQATAVLDMKNTLDASDMELGLIANAEYRGDVPGTSILQPLMPAPTYTAATVGTGPDTWGTLTHAAYTISMNQPRYNATLNDITNNLSVVSSNNFEGRIAALEAWRATGIDYNCDTGNTLIVMKDWEFDDVNNKIINTYRSITIVDGLVTSQNCGLPDGETPVTSCPP